MKQGLPKSSKVMLLRATLLDLTFSIFLCHNVSSRMTLVMCFMILASSQSFVSVNYTYAVTKVWPYMFAGLAAIKLLSATKARQGHVGISYHLVYVSENLLSQCANDLHVQHQQRLQCHVYTCSLQPQSADIGNMRSGTSPVYSMPRQLPHASTFSVTFPVFATP